MNLPEDKNQDESRLRVAAEGQIEKAPQDELRARPAEELLHELRVHQVELEMQNEALREAQIELAQSRNRYADLYEFAPVGYLTLGAHGMIDEINLTGATLLGRERKMLLLRDFKSLVIAEDQPRWIQHFLDVKNGDGDGDGHGRVELALQRGDGAVLQAQLDCARPEGITLGVRPDGFDAPREKSAPGVRIALTDNTERRHVEAARAALEGQLRESQKMEALGTLAGGIAHDINNMLAIILGNVELLRQEVGANPRLLKSMEDIRKAGSRACDLVRQILAFSRRQVTELKRTALAPIVEESVRLLRATLPARLTLAVHCGADVPAVLADPSLIQQVLINLATNAMQSMKSGPGHIDIRLDTVMLDAALADAHPALHAMCAKHPGRAVRLAVSDDGPGMNAAILGRIFEPFFTTKAKGEGTGLGLSVVHGIVQAHEGVIVVDSEPGKGTTFTLYLPAERRLNPCEPEPAASAAATVPAPATVPALILGGGRHILYLDDEDALVILVERMMKRRGFRVSGYTDQGKALDALHADPAGFDLVVTDYNMPGMSGLDVAREVRAIRADLPVALASGFIDEELHAEAEGAGVTELIFKADGMENFCDIAQRLSQAAAEKLKAT